MPKKSRVEWNDVSFRVNDGGYEYHGLLVPGRYSGDHVVTVTKIIPTIEQSCRIEEIVMRSHRAREASRGKA